MKELNQMLEGVVKMKFIINRVMVALVLVALAGTAAFAKTKRTTIKLDMDTKVNGTVVSRGTYDVVFDDQTNELAIVKGNKVLLKAATRLEMRDRKANANEVHFRTIDVGTELIGIAFSGSDQNVVINQAGMQAGGN